MDMAKMAEWIAGGFCVRNNKDGVVHLEQPGNIGVQMDTECDVALTNWDPADWPPDCPRCIAAIEKEMKREP